MAAFPSRLPLLAVVLMASCAQVDDVYPWEDEEGVVEEGAEGAEAEAADVLDDAGGEWAAIDAFEEEQEQEDGLAWDGDEGAAAAGVDADLEFERANAEYDTDDGRHERALLAKLRKDVAPLLQGKRFELEPFGSYVTGLGVPSTEDTGVKSDLDVVLLFHDTPADDKTLNKGVREEVVRPTIEKLGAWLQRRPGVSVKNIIRQARVPIVTFVAGELEVDISVQQPWGVLNSWHLRDLCDSGRPGRLRLLTRFVKLWAKSKSIHTAKDGGLSSYGYAMLCAAYLRECGALPALLGPEPYGGLGACPYLDSDAALHHVLGGCAAARKAAGGQTASPAEVADVQRSSGVWRVPECFPSAAGEGDSHADAPPLQLFANWMEWVLGNVLGFVEGIAANSVGSVPLSRRHITSVRDRTQEEVRLDVTWSPARAQHWSPSSSEVFMAIEEPLSGENVGRSVRKDGFWAIHAEVKRACEFLAENLGAETESGDFSVFKALLEQAPLSTRQQPFDGKGMGGTWQGAKRPFDGKGQEEPPHKRFKGGKSGFDSKGKAGAPAWAPLRPLGAPASLRLPPMWHMCKGKGGKAGKGAKGPKGGGQARPPHEPPPAFLHRSAAARPRLRQA